MLKINQLAVRPEALEGRMANYDTAPEGEEILGVLLNSSPLKGEDLHDERDNYPPLQGEG